MFETMPVLIYYAHTSRAVAIRTVKMMRTRYAPVAAFIRQYIVLYIYN
jgi:hypothetical protein